MNNASTLREYLNEQTSFVEQALNQILSTQWHIPQLLRESMHYSLMAGGKRLRPILVIAAAEALGGSRQSALPVACAIEMIHTYSLIHDDLPAMDNDDYRRGKLTNHKVYGDAMAILAGDALLTHAFYMITQLRKETHLDSEHILAIVEELSIYAGAKGMIGGQAADILAEQGLTKLEELEYIHTHKTSDLIVFSLRAGGRIAGATSEQLDALTLFGSCIGLAFQIQDDILDLTGDEVKLGKPLKSDENKQKVTFPYFIGLEASERKVIELTDKAIDAIQCVEHIDAHRLLQLAEYLMRRDY